jgi:hypothetical protein
MRTQKAAPGSSTPPQGGQQPSVIHTPVAEHSAPSSKPPARIPGAVDAGLQTTSGNARCLGRR